MNGNNSIMVQCLLGHSSRYQVAWIPERKAVVCAIVELIDKDRRHPGWRVISAGTRLPEAYVRERSRDYVNTRRASDI